MGQAAMAVPAALSGFASILGGIGQSQEQKAAAAQDRIRALDTQTAADQTDSQALDELHGTLGNIYAIRAAAGAPTDSPTVQAVIDRQMATSERQRSAQRGNYMAQKSAYLADADMRMSSARMALFGGAINGLAKFGQAYSAWSTPPGGAA